MVGDFHLQRPHAAGRVIRRAREALAKYRINPGNVGIRAQDATTSSRTMIEIAMQDTTSRCASASTGASLDQELLTRLMDENCRAAPSRATRAVMHGGRSCVGAVSRRALAEELGLGADQIIISAQGQRRAGPDRASTARWPRAATTPLHLGLTEAGHGVARASSPRPRRWASCCRKASATPSASRSRPSPAAIAPTRCSVAQEILQTMGIRQLHADGQRPAPAAAAPPARIFQELAQQIQTLPPRRRCRTGSDAIAGVEDMTVAVMGCVVNGPGESKHADIGISLPGTGEVPAAPVYVDGEKTVTLKGDRIAEEFRHDRRALCPGELCDRRDGGAVPAKARDADRSRFMSKTPQAVRGMNDVLPDEHGAVARVRRDRRSVARSAGATAEIRMPLVEHTAAVPPRDRRGDRHRREGDVLLARRAERRRSLTLRPGGHRVVRARRDRAQPRVRRPGAALVRRPDVPP
jgi:(E)-4-hydroxy-3-methylbut-2-enyl-diphosphate synthase